MLWDCAHTPLHALDVINGIYTSEVKAKRCLHCPCKRSWEDELKHRRTKRLEWWQLCACMHACCMHYSSQIIVACNIRSKPWIKLLMQSTLTFLGQLNVSIVAILCDVGWVVASKSIGFNVIVLCAMSCKVTNYTVVPPCTTHACSAVSWFVAKY